MKRPSLLLMTAALGLFCVCQAQAVILPPTDDTSGTLTYNKANPPVVTKRSLTSANGSSGSLPVSKTRTAFIRFEVEGAGITTASLNQARLTLYFPSVTKAGDLSLHVVTQIWDENFPDKTRTHPAVEAPFLTIPAASVVRRQFIIVDVTEQVRAALENPGTRFGFAVSSPDGMASLSLGAKEGSGTGYPPLLEMDGGSITSSQLAPGLTLGGTTTGTFVGDGSGLTNLPASALAGTISSAQLASGLTLGGITDFSGVINLTSATGPVTGAIRQNGSTLLHTYGTNNLFLGPQAGNFSMTGNGNYVVGGSSFLFNTTGSQNTALGFATLFSNTTGSENTAIGRQALQSNTTGSDNTAVGPYALRSNSTSYGNTVVGRSAAEYSTGGQNTAIGRSALINNSSGTGNIALGHQAGSSLTTGSNNIVIGNAGVAGESNVIRIGTSQTATYLTGVIHGDGSGLTGIASSSGSLPYTTQSVALLKWGVATVNNAYSAGPLPTGICFDGTHIWVTNTFAGTVTKLNASNGATIGTYGAGALGAVVYGVCFDGVHIWATSFNGLTKFNASTGAVIGTYSTGSIPKGVCFDGATIWATGNNNTVVKVNPSTGAVIGTYNVGTDPNGICFDGTSIWTSNIGSDNVTKVNPSTGAVVGTYSVGTYPQSICFDGTSIWTANNDSDTVTKLNKNTGATIGTYAAGTRPFGICFDGVSIWVTNGPAVNNVQKINAATGATIATYTVGSGPRGVCFDGASIWTANYGTDNVTKL